MNKNFNLNLSTPTTTPGVSHLLPLRANPFDNRNTELVSLSSGAVPWKAFEMI